MLCVLYQLNRCDVYHCYSYNYLNYHANMAHFSFHYSE